VALLSPPADLVDLSTAGQVAASTRHLVTEAFTRENVARQADRDPTALTMSGLGGCTRACAYAVAGTPPSDVPPVEDARQAILGVWIHEHLLPWLARLLGPDAVFEQPVELRAAGLAIPGTLDLAVQSVVWDVKTVKEWRLHGVRRRGTFSEHRLQVLGYGLARHQAGYPVKWVVFLYIDRSTGEVHVEVEEFTNRAALAVIDRVELLRFHARDPDRAPRDGRGPGVSFACDRCPWLRRCWGDNARPGQPGVQRILAATPAGIEEALRLYAEGSAAAADGRRDQDFAKLVLEAVPAGGYGRWELVRGRPGEMLDQQRVREIFAARAEPVPMMPTAGRLIVKSRPQEA
jgi:hypothetical protein